MRRLTLVASALLLLAPACRQKPKPPERTEPWLASARASASSSPFVRRVHYRLATSRLEFELPAKRGTPKGRFSRAQGELDVDLDDLSRTTGRVLVDLDTVELLASSGLVDGPNTGRALDWLELGADIAPDRRDGLRQVAFQIGALDAGHLVTVPSEARPTRRRELVSQWAVRGELSLHGVRAEENAEITLTLVPGPDASAPPAELLIRSRHPLVVSLGTHDIRPREGHGVSVTKDQGLLGEHVGREARVTFDLTFVPGR